MAEVVKTEGVATTVNACRAAIMQTWPQGLWQGAFTTLHAENGLETATRTGTINSDGSQDFGCLMINNKAHPDFFKTQDWSNPVANANEAYKIYLGRREAEGNGWRAWYADFGKLWK